MKIVKNISLKLMPVCLKVMSYFIPIDPKVILFCSFNGRGYSCNPRAIFEALRDDDDYADYTFIWGMNDPNVVIPGAKVVRMRRWQYFYYLSRAKYWIFNSKMPTYIHKKQHQIYLQTWHGTPLKQLAHDIHNQDQTYYRRKLSYAEMLATYDQDVAKWDHLLVSSSYMQEKYASAFRYDRTKTLWGQYPRNAVLQQPTPEHVVTLKQQFGLPLDKKVILYAPTFRDDSYSRQGYAVKLDVDFKQWYEALGDDYVVLFKPHYLIANTVDVPAALDTFIYPVAATAEINDCYLISDVLITDYSSVFFDYALLERPIYFYMYDFDNYKEVLRGFYLDPETELPNRVIKDQATLLSAIKHQDFDAAKLAAFNERFNPKDVPADIRQLMKEVIV